VQPGEPSTQPTWRELATDWRVWLSIVLGLIAATLAWLLGYG
jgi:hypothetical protein